jgi:hypothetical protein
MPAAWIPDAVRQHPLESALEQALEPGETLLCAAPLDLSPHAGDVSHRVCWA